MEITLIHIVMVCILIFFAGLVDAIAGGGGLISVPAYFFAGIPPHYALATNKFSSCIGTFFSTMRYIKHKRYHLKSAIVSVISAFIGSWMGAHLILMLDEKLIKVILVITLPVIGILLMTRKNFRQESSEGELSLNKIIILSVISAFLIGAYDGFYGPGTGTLLILFHTSLIGFNMTTASGNAKIINLTSNIAALITFLINGKVLFLIGIPAAICSIIGHVVGSGLAIKKGAKIIRPVFYLVFAGLMLKIGLDVFF